MKELITISTNEQGQQLVSARELHVGLQIATPFRKWFPRMIEYGFVENEDFTLDIFVHPLNGQKTSDYIMTLDMAKEISMIQRNELGKQFRQYFIECEKQLQEVKPQIKLPTTYKEALIELVATIEEKEKIEAEKNKLIHDKKVYTASEIAKELGFKSAQELNKDLKEKKIQYKVNNTWVLCARYSECGYTTTRQIELETGKIIYDTRWTGKGRDWLVNNIYK